MKHYEEYCGMAIEIDDNGELDVRSLWNDNEVSDRDYAIAEERLRQQGIRFND